MTKKNFSIGYKSVVWTSLFLGIWLNIANTSSVVALLSYYTLQSNILCLVAFSAFIVIEIRKKEKTEVYYLIKGAVLVVIAVTAIVYAFALMPVGFEMSLVTHNKLSKTLANLLVHVVSPILVLLDYFLFDQKGNFKWYYPFIWLIVPSNYAFYVYAYSAHGGFFYNIGGSKRFAYFFLDYIEIGIGGVVKWMIVICFGILALSYLLIFLDKRLSKK